MAKSGLAFSVALGTVLIALLATPALGERYLESGEKCAFPLEFNVRNICWTHDTLTSD